MAAFLSCSSVHPRRSAVSRWSHTAPLLRLLLWSKGYWQIKWLLRLNGSVAALLSCMCRMVEGQRCIKERRIIRTPTEKPASVPRRVCSIAHTLSHTISLPWWHLKESTKLKSNSYKIMNKFINKPNGEKSQPTVSLMGIALHWPTCLRVVIIVTPLRVWVLW